MAMSLCFFFFISIISTISSITNITHAYSHCQEDEKSLLLNLKNDLIFDPSFSRKLVHWNRTEDCCSWDGVECNDAGHVISLRLDHEAISGGIENSSSLFNLRYLEKLDLAYNKLEDIEIPRGIQNLTYLTHLNLSNAGFSGQVPDELLHLRRLVSLDISCVYWGFWPLKLEHPSLEMLLKNLTGLRELYLDGIPISARGSEWGHLISSSAPELTALSLGHCNLSGPLNPSLLKLSSLSYLRLDFNNISSPFPDFLTNFTGLSTLSLSMCSLKGTFPEKIFQVPTLQNLDLSSNVFLNGNIPQFNLSGSFRSIVLASTNFSGTIPDSVSNLTFLSILDLSYCRFGGRIPSVLANLTELTTVGLSGNFFTGFAPLFHMSPKLARLDLSHNNLTGPLSSLNFQGLSHLEYVDLGYNLLTGSIPPSLFGLPSLVTLMLNNNRISGRVNEFPTPHPSNLVRLDLSSNRLEGPIPEFFFELESLAILSLSNNLFSGTFQLQKIRKPGNLSSLDLSYNKLTVDASNVTSRLYGFPQLYELGLASCNLHYFPDLRNQSSLTSLDLSNNMIRGEIPNWIWEVGNGYLSNLNLSFNLLVDLQKPYRFPTQLQYLDLNSNQLQGELPPVSGGAWYVDYSNNFFDRFTPLNITSSPYTFAFYSLANNSLSGPIPASFCQANYLRLLDLSFNNFSGEILSCLLFLEELQVLKLGNNNISGNIWEDVFTDYQCDLKSLDLGNNKLGGKVPTFLANCKSLEILNVENNEISDSFPCMLPSSLRVLVLRSNRFHGEVRCQNKSWPNLQIIDIASNNFSSNLNSISFSSWTGMVMNSDAHPERTKLGFTIILYPNFYYFTQVALNVKGSEQTLFKIRVDFTSIDFSCNNFRGEIPDAIGDLSALYLLNLSHNSLTGEIPKSFGNLTQLGALDLSVNKLMGMIPKELTGLTFLSVLNLSYNKLAGVIPSGRQFQTFSADSFEGNTRLCGFPLNISCVNGLSPPNSAQSHQTMEIEWDYVSAALGYVVGLGSIAWALLCCGSLRRVYFAKVDEVLENISGHHDRKRRRARRRRVHRNDQVRRH
ncbi:hypothetical protein ACS0TY_009508 [Phlomoides rotata]